MSDNNQPPILEVETNLPPMIHDQTPPTAGSAAPNDDLIMPAIVTTTTQKKKFAGGKIIATILGLFLLVGGIGAGVFLVGQNQDIREKATPGEPPPGCAITPPTNINVTNITANSATLNWTPGTGGDYVKLFVSSNSGGDPTGDCNRLSSRTTDSICVANENTDYGLAATPSTYQVTGMSPSTRYYWRIMMWKESGCDYAAPTISFVTVLSATATPTTTPTSTPTATPTTTPTSTPTATPTTNPTGAPNSCNGTCGSNSNCQSNYICYIPSGSTSGNCRNTQCLTETDCTCAVTTTAPTTQPTLPVVGTSWPTLLGTGFGVLVIIGSLFLAL